MFLEENEEIVEKRVEHWVADTTVLTLKVFAKAKCEDNGYQIGRRNASTFSIERPTTTGLLRSAKTRAAANAIASSVNDSEKIVVASKNKQNNASNSSPPTPSVLNTSVNFEDVLVSAEESESVSYSKSHSTTALLRSGSNERSSEEKFRRRHLSSTQGVPQRQSLSHLPLQSIPNAGATTAVSRADNRANAFEDKNSPQLSVDWIQLTVRHVFGKDTWVMRAFDQIPVDLFQGVNSTPFADPSSMLLHLCGREALRIPAKENEATQRTLRLLDKIPAEELHAVGVLYIGEGQTTEAEILANQFGSERYVKFIRLLGNVVSLDNDPCGLQMGRHGKFTYEYADSISKIVFLVATLMPNSDDDPRCTQKKSLIGNNFVSIVFNESGNPYKLGIVTGQFDRVTLEVVPHDDETVVVSLHSRREIGNWLAITRAFLPDSIAVKAIRKMAIRAQLSVNVWRSLDECSRNPGLKPYLSQTVDRLRKIQSLRSKGVAEN